MTQAEIQQFVYNFLYDKGLPHISICALMGNITAESAWNVDAIENGSGIGFGLCQWSYGRRTQLEAYGTSLQKQCEFLWSELTGQNTDTTGADYQWIADPSNSVDNGAGFYCSNNAFLNGDGDIEFLTTAFCYCWERPAYETNHLTTTRIPSATEFYSSMSYNGSGVGGGGSGDSDTDPDTPNKKHKFNFILFNASKRRLQNGKTRFFKSHYRNRQM